MKLESIFEKAEIPIPELPSEGVVTWLRDIGLAQNIINEFQSYSRNGPIRVNKVYFNHFNEFIEYNLDEQNKFNIAVQRNSKGRAVLRKALGKRIY